MVTRVYIGVVIILLNCAETGQWCYKTPGQTKAHSFRSSDTPCRSEMWNKNIKLRGKVHYNMTLSLCNDDGTKNKTLFHRFHWTNPSPKSTTMANPAFFIPRYTKAGLYMIETQIIPIDKAKQGPEELEKCYMLIVIEHPVALITGGEIKTVVPGTELTLYANTSRDIDHVQEKVNDPNPGPLVFVWTCKQTPPGSFCDKGTMSTSDELKLPTEVMKEGSLITVKLTAFASNGGHGIRSCVVQVKEDVALLSITCRRNCAPVVRWTLQEIETMLDVECQRNCRGIREEHYQWTIREETATKKFKMDYNKRTFFGPTGHKFGIRTYVMDTCQNYVIEVTLKGAPRKGSAKMTIETGKGLGAVNCLPKDVNVKNQKSITTRFKFECNHITNLTDVEFYADGEYVTTLPIDSMEVRGMGYPKESILSHPAMPRLPANMKNLITIGVDVRSGHTSQMAVYKLKVTSSTATMSTAQKLGVFNRLMKPPLDLSTLKVLVDELSITKVIPPIQRFIDGLRERVLTNLTGMVYETREQVLQATQTFRKLMQIGATKKTITTAELRVQQQICNRMAEFNTKILMKDKNPFFFQHRNDYLKNAIIACYELSGSKKVDLYIREDVPVDDDETQPDYEVFSERYFKELDDLKAITSTMISSIAHLAKNMAITTPLGGRVKDFNDKMSRTRIYKDRGKYLVESNLKVTGAELIPPWEFEKSEHEYEIFLTTFLKDLMSWNSKKIHVNTVIVGVEFWHAFCAERIDYFETPVQLFLDLKENALGFDPLVISGVLNDSWSGLYPRMELNSRIQVHRINLPVNYGLRIHFEHVSPEEELEVVVTKFKYPTIEDFASMTVIKSTSRFVQFTNNENYTIWAYIGILPHNNETFVYNASLTASICVRWTGDQWVPSCKSGLKGSYKRMHCECYNFSIIAGYLEYIDAIQQVVLDLDTELQLEVDYVVFITAAITWCLFWTIVVLGARRALKISEKVFYLADNVKTDLYCYLVSVKTGDRCGAGTTSKITIIVHGKRTQSTAHVLNYPDPEQQLLQTNTRNTFILTTTKYLRNLRQLELWFDASGLSPSWFCEEITIFDMQSRQEWYFKIDTLFSVLKGTTYFSTRPSTRILQHRSAPFCNQQNTWFLNNKDESFSNLRRLAVMLSKIMSTYVCVLLFLGLPIFERNVCLDSDNLVTAEFIVSASLISSMGVFIFHVPIIVIFRFSKVQYGANIQNPPLSARYALGCWIVVIVVIMVSMSLLIVYGFWLTYMRCMLWLTCSAIAIAIDFVILDNVLVALCKFHLKIQPLDFRKRFNSIRAAIETQRQILHHKLGIQMLRPFLQRYYVPLNTREERDKTEYYKERKRVTGEVCEFFIFAVYIVCLYLLMNLNQNSLFYHNKSEIEAMLEGRHTNTLGFSDVGDENQFLDYVNGSLLPVTHPTSWYPRYPIIRESGLMIDCVNKFLGAIRLRQHRIRINICAIPVRIKHLNMSCAPEFSTFYGERGSFSYSWTNYSEFMLMDPKGDMWNYSDSSRSGALAAFGNMAYYPGGGYLAFFGTTLHNTLVNLNEIFSRFWIDNKTRSVMMEMLIYNTNLNLFNGVTLLYEHSASGFVYPTIEIQVARLLTTDHSLEVATRLVFISCVVLVVALAVRKLFTVLQHPSSFYHELWFWFDVVVIVLSLVCMMTAVAHLDHIAKYFQIMAKVKDTSIKRYYNYFTLFFIDELLKIFGSILIGLATIRLCGFLNFATILRIQKRTFSRCWGALLTYVFACFVCFNAFTLSAMLAFGNDHEDFNHYVDVYRTLFSLILKLQVPKIFDRLTSLLHFYFVFYLIFIRLSFNVITTTILRARREANSEFSSRNPDVYTLWDYLKEVTVNSRLGCWRLCLRTFGGGRRMTTPKVTPKIRVFRYAKSMTIGENRLNLMRFTTLALLSRLSGKSTKAMATFAKKPGGQNKEIFFSKSYQTRKPDFVCDSRLLCIEYCLNSILRSQGAHLGNVMSKTLEDMRQFELSLNSLVDKLNDINMDIVIE